MDNSTKTAACDKNEKLQWNQFSEWVHCFAVVTFDLELGQAMEVIMLRLTSHNLVSGHDHITALSNCINYL